MGADFSIIGDVLLNSSSLQSGLSAMTVAAGNLISNMVSQIADATKQAIDQVYQLGTAYETSLAKVSSISGDTGAVLEEVSAQVLELSNATGKSAADINEAVYNVISATGSSALDALDMVEQANTLAVGGFTSLDSAVSALTTATNAYASSNLEAADVANSLIMTQNLGVTTVDSLASSMGKAIATGSAYNISLGNIESGYVSLTKSGISTEEATTYLASMFNELGDAGSDVGAILKEETGKSFGQLMNDGYSLSDVLSILNDSVDGDAEALMNLWGSAEAGKASNAILNQGLETFNENLVAIEGSTTAASDAYSTMTDTMEFKTGVLQTNVENLGIGLYDAFSDGLLPIVDLGLDIVQQLTDGLSENGVQGMLSAAGAMVGQFIETVISSIPDVLDSGTQMIVRFIDDLSSSGKLNQMLSTAGRLITTLLSGIITRIPDLIGAAARLIASFVTYIAQNFPQILQTGGELLGQLIAGIIQNILNIGSAALQCVSAFKSSWKENGGWKGLGSDLINGIISGITGSVGKIAEAARNAAKSALNAAKNFLGIKSPSRRAKEEIGKQFDEGTAEGVEENSDRMVDAAQSSAEEMVAAAQGAVMDNQVKVGGHILATSTNAAVVTAAASSGKGTVSTGDVCSLLQEAVHILGEYLPEIANMEIVLDSGKTVGALVQKMDKALGARQQRKARG